MQAADAATSNVAPPTAVVTTSPRAEAAIQRALAYNLSELRLSVAQVDDNNPSPLTVIDMECLLEVLPLFETLIIARYSLHNDDDDDDDVAVLDALCNGLLQCTSITTVTLREVNLGTKDLQLILPAFYNTSIRRLSLAGNNIIGQRGGEILCELLNGNKTLLELSLKFNTLSPEGAIGLGKGLLASSSSRLQKLDLSFCSLGNKGLANLVAASAGNAIYNSPMTDLKLDYNNIGAEGGAQIMVLLQRFPSLKALSLSGNHLGPLFALSLAPSLFANTTTASSSAGLESLDLSYCGLGNDGVANLFIIPNNNDHGQQVNRSLKILDLSWNKIHGTVGGDAVIAFATRCTKLDCIQVMETPLLQPDPRCRLELLLERNRMITKAQSLAGRSTFSLLFQVVEEAHGHEYGLDAIFVILQNDGDDLFYTAFNRAIT